MKQLWTKSFVLLTSGMLFLYTGFYSLLPVLPVHMEQLGAGSWQIGVIIGLFTLSAVVSRPLVGRLLDLNGRNKYMLLGIIFFAFFMLCYGWTANLALLIVLRILHGASWGLANTALGTAITDCIPEERKGEGMGWYGLSMTAAMATGPLLGTWMLEQYTASALFAAACAISLIPLAAAMLVPTAYRPQSVPSAQFQWNRPFVLTLLVISMLSFSFGGVTTYVPLYAANQGAGQFFIVYALVLSLSRPLAGYMIDRKGGQPVVAGSLTMVVLSLLILGTVQNAAGITLSAAMYGIGFGMAQPALQTIVHRMMGKGRGGTANAMFFTAFDVGIGTGAILLGVASEFVGYSWLFLISGAVVLWGWLLFRRASAGA